MIGYGNFSRSTRPGYGFLSRMQAAAAVAGDHFRNREQATGGAAGAKPAASSWTSETQGCCQVCNASFSRAGTGRLRLFCSDSCRDKARPIRNRHTGTAKPRLTIELPSF